MLAYRRKRTFCGAVCRNNRLRCLFSDYSTPKIIEHYNDSTSPECTGRSDYVIGYSVGFLTVEALSAIAGSNSSMYLYKYMSSGKTFEEAFEIIYGSSWEEAKPILASYVSSTINQLYNYLTLTTEADPVAGGTVTGGGSHPSGASVTVIATPNAGYRLRGWTTTGPAAVRCEQQSAPLTCTVMMVSDLTVRADFLLSN